MKIHAAGPDTPITENAQGGKQSACPYRLDLMPPLAELAVAGVLGTGAIKYEEWNWTRIPAKEHLAHARSHIAYFTAGETSEGPPIEHAKKAACRVLMWLEMLLREEAEKTGEVTP